MEDEEREKQCKELQEWLSLENISNARRDREMILKFLYGCKNQTEEAKYKMRNFYEVRKSSPELFQGRDPLLENLDALLTLGAFFPLPLKAPQGHTLVVVKAAPHDPRLIPMTDVFKVGIMSVDLLLELDDGVARHGVGVVVDLRGAALGHALQMTPALVRKMAHLWQGCYPIPIQGIDFVNVPPGVDFVLNLFRRFLGQNLRKRLRSHRSVEGLREIIPSRFLPEEYGGTLGPESSIITDWKRKVQTYRRWFLEDETLK